MRSLRVGRQTIILVLAAVCGLGGCASVAAPTPTAAGTATGTTQPPAAGSPAATPGRNTAAPGGHLAYLRRIHTGSKPCAVLGAAGSVWVADFADTRVSRIDPVTDTITARVGTGAQPCGMASGAGSVWVENYGGNDVTRINVRTLRTRSYPVGASPYDITFAGGAAWTTNYGDGTVTRIDAATGQERTLRVGISPVGIAHASGAVWVANQGSGTMSRIDTATLKVTTIKLGGKPSWTAYSRSTVWVGDQAAGTVVRIDARAGSVGARVKVGSTPNDGDVGDGAVWFPDRNGGLYRIGEKSNAVTGPYPLQAGNPFTLSAYAGRLWIADFAGTDVIVVDPARLPANT